MEQMKIPVLISESEISKRISELGKQISEDYRGKELILVGVIKGAIPFFLKLAQEIKLDQIWDFLAVSSYGEKTKSSGVVKINMDLATPITGRHVLIIEDIVDTGLTMEYLTNNLRIRKPASLKVCALLTKQGTRERAVKVDYTGFEIPNKFVVGFGLDHAEKLRELPYIGHIAE